MFIIWVWKYWNTHSLVQMNFMVWVSLVAGSDKSYPSWHLYLVWGISSLHFLYWFNTFEGYYHSKFWKFLSKFAVTFCVEAMFTVVFYFSPFLHCLKHWYKLEERFIFPDESFVCHIEMTDMKNEENFVSYCREACFQFSLVMKPSRCSWNKLYYLC